MSAATMNEMERLRRGLGEVKAERDALAAQLARYSMCAGRADQRQSESRAVRKALGFNPDADDVSPRDLLDALARLKAEWQAEALEKEANGWPEDQYAECSHVRMSILESAAELRRQAEEGTNGHH